ncbi:hypothetical protein MNBD_NITROSPINAE01-683 [hydrothermal vent metagenome]|uniref:TNase-like domain-containing protein n=1 Tax=hydrothermal vent metagenome TaxID=652676 RepID=A0A3B1CMI6_9ZZZZ
MTIRFALITAMLLLGLFTVSEAVQRHKQLPLIWGKVFNVYDGDTVAIKDKSGREVRVQLAYIDAPDMDSKTGDKQPLHAESMKSLAKMIKGKEVIIESTGKDKFNRVEGIIYLDRLNVNLEMIRRGMAEIYYPVRVRPKSYIKEYVDQFLKVEKYAKKSGHGVWSLPDYTSPYKFRRRHR